MIDKKFWKNKRVLVTGHTGFKGGWLSLWLKLLGAKVYGYSLNPITKKNFFNETKLKKIFAKEVRKNIQNKKEIENFIKKNKPQIIFHLAAQPQVLESFNDPVNTIYSNIIGTVNLLESIRKKKYIKALINITTDKVYKNSEKDIKFKEDFCLGGDDIYSSSKASADIITLSYIKSFFDNSNCNISTVRAGNCIGGGDWTKYRILTDSVSAFYKKKELIIRRPKAKRPWQHLLEPLAGYIILAQKLCSKKGKKFNGAWNFGPDRRIHLSVLEFAKIFGKKLNPMFKIKIRKATDKREKMNLDLDSSKAKIKLKWKTFLSIQKTLSMTAEWYLANHKKRDMLDFTSKQILEFNKYFNKKK